MKAYIKGIRLVASIAALSAFACGSTAQDNTTTQAVSWALGSRHRKPPSTDAGSYVLLLPTGSTIDTGKRRTSNCAQATSLLPAPSPDSRVFLAINGALHVASRDGTEPEAPRKLDGLPAGLQLARLLGFRKDSSPLSLLATAWDEKESKEALWALDIGQDAIVAVHAVGATSGCGGGEEAPDLANQETFFRSYEVPRCQAAGARCLVVNEEHGEAHLDVEAQRNGKRQNLQDFGHVDVRDAAWVSDDEKMIALLVSCEAPVK